MNPLDASTKPGPENAPSGQGLAGPLVTLTDTNLGRTGYLVASQFPTPLEAGQGAPGLTGTPTFGSLLRALRRRWLLAGTLATGGAALIVAAVVLLLPAKYVSQARIQVPSRGEAPVFHNGNPDETEWVIYKANVASMVKSPWVINIALNQKTAQGKPIKDLNIVREKGAAIVEWLEAALKTDFLLGPETLRVSLGADQADEVADLLNAIARSCVEENDRRDSTRRQQRLEQLGQKQRELEGELGELRKQMRTLEKDNKVEDKEARQTRYAAALQKLLQYEQAVLKNNLDQISAREEINVLKDRLENIKDLPVSEDKLEEGLRTSAEGQGLFKQIEEIDYAIQQIRSNGKEELVKALVAKEQSRKKKVLEQLVDVREQIRPDLEKRARAKWADEMGDRLVKVTDSLNSLSKQEAILKTEYNKVDAEVAKLAPSNQPEPPSLVTMRDKVGSKQASLEQVAKTINLMRAEVQNPRISLMQMATEPTAKETSRQIKMAGAGGIGMFLLMMFGVAFIEYRSGKINGVEEVAQGLGLSVVGTLPARPNRARATKGRTSPRHEIWRHQFDEAVDGIRTMLLHAARSENLRVIMVSSACVGEGKTTLASQLASSLARAWRNTLLLDGDLRSPSAHKLFDLPLEPGFSEVLRGEVRAGAAVTPTALSRLSLMSGGHWDSHAVQALAQDNVCSVLEDLKQQFDFIIIDSAPLLPVADSLLLGQHVDGVLLSVLRDVSRAPAVQAAQQKLHHLGIRTLGAVVIGMGNDLGNLGYQYMANARS